MRSSQRGRCWAFVLLDRGAVVGCCRTVVGAMCFVSRQWAAMRSVEADDDRGSDEKQIEVGRVALQWSQEASMRRKTSAWTNKKVISVLFCKKSRSERMKSLGCNRRIRTVVYSIDECPICQQHLMLVNERQEQMTVATPLTNNVKTPIPKLPRMPIQLRRRQMHSRRFQGARLN